jgi:hypothetical protein
MKQTGHYLSAFFLPADQNFHIDSAILLKGTEMGNNFFFFWFFEAGY